MALIIEQRPLYKTIAAGQEIIYVLNESTGNIVTTKTNVNYVAEIRVSVDQSELNQSSSSIGTFKSTPNDKGVGIFELSTILENYVSPDYNGVDTEIAAGENVSSTWRGNTFENNNNEKRYYHALHLVDRYCLSQNSIKYVRIFFKMEYLGADINNPNAVGFDPYLLAQGDDLLIFNGVVYDTDVLTYSDSSFRKFDFGYNLSATDDTTRPSYILQNSGTDIATATGQMLSDAPLAQEARLTDYGTLPFLNFLRASQNTYFVGNSTQSPNSIGYIAIKLYNDVNVQLGSTIVAYNRQTNGGYSAQGTDISNNFFATTRLIYFGAFPANLDGAYIADNATYADWNTHKANVSYYKLQAYQEITLADDTPIGKEFTINIVKSDCKYESIRLVWLNKHGAWDYYTFRKKSVRSLATNRTNYTQLAGTWNQSSYSNLGSSGGEKNFRVNTRESIKMNTDFVTEADAVWFEQLINSTEVYILNGYNSDGALLNAGNINRYVEPVTVQTSSYVRKTKGNDKLIQYTFDVQRASDRRTQRV
tara:strand:+ start:378 stop:1979 length:1602 start_codon:yes stop_codon:yes gene_type:complete